MNPHDAPSRVALGEVRSRPWQGSWRALTAAALVGGFGLAASVVTLVRAADDVGILDIIRSDALNRVAGAVRLPSREARPYEPIFGPRARAPARIASRPVHPVYRKPVPTKARAGFAAVNARIASRRTMCVRTCDGYAFPVGTFNGRGDLGAHQSACAAACPGTPTQLYTMAPGGRADDLAGARSVLDGSLYGRLRTAFLFQKKLVAACSCQGPDNIARHLPVLMDPTIRSGDVVIDRSGDAKVYAGTGRVPHASAAFSDYRRSPAIGNTARAQIDRLVGTTQRELAAREFERSLRTQRASLEGPSPMREVQAPAGSGSGVRVYQVRSDMGTLDPSGARVIVLR